MISFECPSCGKRLNAPDEGAGRDGRCGCGATFTIPRHGDAAEPIDCEPDPIYRRRRRKKSLPPALVLIAVFLLAIGTVVAVAAAFSRVAERHRENDKDGQARTESRPVRQSTEDDSIDQGREHFRSGTTIGALFCAGFGVVVAIAPPVIAALLHSNRRRTAYLAILIWGCVGFWLGSLLGIFLSQFAPAFGGFIEVYLCRPFTVGRVMLIPIHVLAFGGVGLLLGAGVAILKEHTDR